MPVFATPEPISVTLDVASANVRLIASDRTDTHVEVRPSRPSKPADVKAAEQAEVDFIAGRLRVSTSKGWRYYSAAVLGPGEQIDVVIELPEGSAVHGEFTNGSFRAEGRLGACNVKTGAGNITLDEAGPLDVHTGAGSVSANRTVGNAEVSTGSGGVRIREVHGTATVKNSYGDTRIDEVTGELRVNGAYGAIEVDRAEASVIVKTSHGNVRLEEVVRGQVQVETSYGALEVGVRTGTAVWLDVATQHGSVLNSLSSDAGPGETEETVEVRARSNWGDIVIHRSNERNTKNRSNS